MENTYIPDLVLVKHAKKLFFFHFKGVKTKDKLIIPENTS